jgi:hypothetical protein
MRRSETAGTGERGNELRHVDRAPAAGQVVPGRRVVTGHAAEGIVAGGDVDDAGVRNAGAAQRAQRVQRGVDETQPVVGILVGGATTPENIGAASLGA